VDRIHPFFTCNQTRDRNGTLALQRQYQNQIHFRCWHDKPKADATDNQYRKCAARLQYQLALRVHLNAFCIKHTVKQHVIFCSFNTPTTVCGSQQQDHWPINRANVMTRSNWKWQMRWTHGQTNLSYCRRTAQHAILVNSCYNSKGMGVKKVSSSKSDLQGHSRSLALVPFDMPHTICH